MNLHTFQISLFRDRTKLRYTKDGRLIIKNYLSSMLDLSNQDNAFYCINKVDMNRQKIEIIFSTERRDGYKVLRLEKIRGNRIIRLQGEISRYGTFKSQYASYNFVDTNAMCVELYYEH